MTATAVLNGAATGTGKAAAKPVDQDVKAQQAIQVRTSRMRLRATSGGTDGQYGTAAGYAILSSLPSERPRGGGRTRQLWCGFRTANLRARSKHCTWGFICSIAHARRHLEYVPTPISAQSSLCLLDSPALIRLVQAVLQRVRGRDPDQKEFLQACEEVLETLEPVLAKYPQVRLLTAAVELCRLPVQFRSVMHMQAVCPCRLHSSPLMKPSCHIHSIRTLGAASAGSPLDGARSSCTVLM
jgi:hypothetical protein